MEHLIYLIIRGMSAIILMYGIASLLWGKGTVQLWYFLNPKPKEKTVILQTKPESDTCSVVGKSQTVYLEKPPEKKPIEPVMSEDLDKETSYEEEPDITGDNVNYISESLSAKDILSEEERFMPFDSPPEEGESTGMTFEQLNVAIDVVSGKKKSDADFQAAARVLYEISGSDVFDFLAAQAENEILIERLLKENIDDGGFPAPENIGKKRRKVEEFDIEKYV